MTNTILAMVGLLIAVSAQPAQAQAGAQAACDGAGRPVADLGITISCDCTVNDSRTQPWVFRSPITVAGVDARGPARGRLRTGDRIVAVNGQAITSEAGARALMTLAPGRAARLTIERDGERSDIEVTPGTTCTRAPDAMGAYAPSPTPPTPRHLPTPAPPPASGAPAPRAMPTPRADAVAPPAPPAPMRTPGSTPAPPPPPARVPMTPDLIPEGFLGFGLACSDCGMEREAGDVAPRWEFSAPPVIYGVEPDGPAARAGLRADDRITHVNGFVVTDERAGAALGGVRPGQTLRLRIERDGVARDVELTAGRRRTGPTSAAPPPAAPPPLSTRYEGRLGDVGIEVRGSEPVAVEVRRDTNEIVIRTSTTQVTLKQED